tara:strand:+ start:862 stop:1371 length:510 start_codon:yes stop_codon:yes gene_type:complete
MFDKRKTSAGQEAGEKLNRPANQVGKNPDQSIENRNKMAVAMIGANIKICGDISGKEDLVIEGKVEGTVSLEGHSLKIGSSGILNANIKATSVHIEGEVTGDITGIEKVIVTKQGKVNGDIKAPRVTLEEGGKIKGSIDMDPAEANDIKTPEPKSVKRPETKNEANKTG